MDIKMNLRYNIYMYICVYKGMKIYMSHSDSEYCHYENEHIYIQQEKTSNILTIDNSVYGVLNSRYVVLDEY